jgi:hypothetical protein
MHVLVKDIMTTDVARHVEGVVAVRDRFTYPSVTEAW